MTPQERARAVVLSWQAARRDLLRGGDLVDLIAAIAAAIEEAVAAERARCVALARDWVPGDVLSELEGEKDA